MRVLFEAGIVGIDVDDHHLLLQVLRELFAVLGAEDLQLDHRQQSNPLIPP
jgi:hypothetical protein